MDGGVDGATMFGSVGVVGKGDAIHSEHQGQPQKLSMQLSQHETVPILREEQQISSDEEEDASGTPSEESQSEDKDVDL